MADHWEIVNFVNTIDKNSNGIITQKEIRKAKKEIPSIWFEKVQEAANGKDIKAESLLMKLGICLPELEPDEPTDSNNMKGKIHRFKVDDEEANYRNALNEAKFFIERTVEKWFKMDINADGFSSNIENHRWDRLNNVDTMNDGDLREQEYAQKYGLYPSDFSTEDFTQSLKGWKEYILVTTAANYGVELSDEDIAMLDEYAKMQINSALVKPDETTYLYQTLGNDAYTRLVTDDQAVSCCGGDVTPPPASDNQRSCQPLFRAFKLTPEERERYDKEFKTLQLQAEQGIITEEECERRTAELQNTYFNFSNTAEEVKNRLTWAVFRTPPERYLNRSKDAYTIWQDMPDGIYRMYHNQWKQLRSMTAADFRNLLKEENQLERRRFEANSSMSVQQIVDYIDIVETVTGHNWDDEDWTINDKQFDEICRRVNGTWGDETVLDGKTKEDVLPERQPLYEYLKANNLLLPQFE